MPGQIGPYAIQGELGRGGMGAVYRALHTELGHDVALKVILNPGMDPTAVARFVREAQAAARLAGHPGLVAVRDLGETDSGPYIAMDFVDGSSLESMIDEEGSLPPRRVAEIGAEIARAVAHAHQNGIIHRDIKPANVLVDRAGQVRITDFGLAQVHRLDSDTARLTQSGAVVGTPAYMPPEQVRDEPLDGRADVYALGATLYEACTGSPPFGAGSLTQLLIKVLREPLPPVRESNPDVPDALAGVIERCLERERDDRYPDAIAVAEDLDRFLAGEEPAMGRLQRRPAKRRWAAVAAVAAVAAAAAGVWGLVAWANRGDAAVGRTQAGEATAGVAQRQFAAYSALVQATRPAMRTLEDGYRGVPLDPARRDQLFEEVRSQAAAIGKREGTPRLAAAWTRLAGLYAARPADPADDTVAPAADEPLAVLLQATAELAQWARTVKLLSVLADRARVSANVVIDAAEGVPHRDRAMALLAALEQNPAWHQLSQRRAGQALSAASAAINADRFQDSVEPLQTAASDPLLEGVCSNLRGVFAVLAGQPVLAAHSWESLHERGWHGASMYASLCYQLGAQALADGGRESGRLSARGVAILDEKLARSPNDPKALKQRGLMEQERGWHEQQRGGNPIPYFQRALEYLAKAATAAPGDSGIRGMQGEVHRQIAQSAPMWGLDPAPALAEAVRLLREAVAMPSVDPVVHLQYALTLQTQAAASTASPAERKRLLDVAMEQITFVQGTAAKQYQHTADRMAGALWLERARQAERPAAQETALTESLAAYDRAVAVNAHDTQARIGRASAYNRLAKLHDETGRDGTQAFDQAEADLTAVRTSHPRLMPARFNLAFLHADRAQRRIKRGADPRERLEAAIELAEALTRDHPRDTRTWGLLATVIERRAEWHVSKSDLQAAATDYRQAAAHYGTALSARPGHATTHYERGNVYIELAGMAKQLGEDPMAHWAAAKADYDAAIAAAPRKVRFRYNRAYLFIQRAEQLDDPELAKRDWTDALADLDEAVRLDPGHAGAWHNRAAVLLRLGRPAEAIQSMEKAVAANPRSEESRRMLAMLKERFGG